MTSTTTRQLCRTDEPSNDSQTDHPLPLSQDDIFHILQTNRRRDAIRYLLDTDEAVKMSDVAEYVAAEENDTTVANLTSAQRQRVYIPLYQSHLPKLDEKGLIEYNKPRGIVRPTDELEIFRPYLEVSDDRSDRSDDESDQSIVVRAAGDYYVGSMCASTSLLLATMVGFLRIPGIALAVLIVGLFTVATIATTVTDSFISDDTAEANATH